MGIDAHVKALTASVDPPLTVETAREAISGAPLKQLWDQSNAVDEIRAGDRDVVVLQEDLAMGTDQQEFYEYVRKFDQEIRKSGAQTVLYMPWQYRITFTNEGTGVTTEAIASAYDKIGKEVGAKVAPVGLAWERSYNERPDFSLFASDSVHPNIQGTYLTACVLYATIFGQNPIGTAYRPADVFPDPATGKPMFQRDMQRMRDQYRISEDEAEFLQRIAWETVQEQQNRQ